MEAAPEFLARLGLHEDADERQVRRAYARELKLIDQERDLQGFQHLRACYEAALDWAARRAVHAEHADPAPAPLEAAGTTPAGQAGPMRDPIPAPTENAGDDPVAIGESVFADFRARMPALAARPERMGQDDDSRIAPWVEALREALADPRLVHLYARAVFEHRIAALLAEGWAPGHHLLLPAAIEVFGWNQDRRALERLGHAGALLDEALEQRAMFQSQDMLARTLQREVLFLLRQGVPAETGTLRGYAPALVALTDDFPTLLGVVAPHDLAAAWRAQVTDEMLRAAQPAADPDARNPWWQGGHSPRMAAVIAVFFLLRLLALFNSHDTQPSDPGASHGFPRIGDDAAERERLRHPKPLYEDEPLGADRIEAIRRRIDYRPGKDVAPGEQAAMLQVVLDADGSILGVNRVRTVGDPAYAAAVERAIRASAPFPPKVAKSFQLGFRTVVGSGTDRARGKAGLPQLPRERVQEVIRRIDYEPGKDTMPGKQQVEFEVQLNDFGAIRRMHVTKMPRDPAFAQAVEQAIRAGTPFSPDTPRSFSVSISVELKRKSPAPAGTGKESHAPADAPPAGAT